ncbi:uncharacterized protein LOC142334532 isoform X2 [Convolutriloba macropyga]|uniref:uncharacterized protein LOC142334532 isoform X2 n=1 Tax=Convolutriloba macropyga TaxID=536237 RepID=UPI003F51BAED
MAAILESSKASLNDHGFPSPLSTPVGDGPSCGTTEIRSRASSSGSIGRVRSARTRSSGATRSRHTSGTFGSSARKQRNSQLQSPIETDDYEAYLSKAIESYGAEEGGFSLDDSFEDSCSNRVSSYFNNYPSIEEGSQLGGLNAASGGGGGFAGGGGWSRDVSGSKSWRRQRSTRISALLTSGNSTDRSSTYSWGEDEFDKHATKCVASMFGEIDKVLYENFKSRNAVLNKECKEWTREFVYIRVLGSSLGDNEFSDYLSSLTTPVSAAVTPVPPKYPCGNSNMRNYNEEHGKASSHSISSAAPSASTSCNHHHGLTEADSSSGFYSQETPAQMSTTADSSFSGDINDSTVNLKSPPSKRNSGGNLQLRASSDLNQADHPSSYLNEFSITGISILINVVPTPVVSFDEYEASTNLGALDMFVEETFEKDGDIEEVFAYDNQELSTEDISQTTEVDSEKKFHVPRRKKKGYPPVTPFACTRDTTFGNMLLTCWPEVIRLAGDYLRKRCLNIAEKLADEFQGSFVTPEEEQLSPTSKDLMVVMQHHQNRISSVIPSGYTTSQVRLNTANSQAAELSDVLSIAPKKIGRKNELGRGLYSEDQSSTSSAANFYYHSNLKIQQPSIIANGIAISSNATKNRYPSAKTRLQPISIARNKQRSTAITSIYNTSHVIHPSVTTQAMAHNPMVVRKLFPETQMTTDRIMTPPISLGGGGYRYNQLPPIDPTQESDFHHQAATLNHTSIGKGLKGAVNSGISKNGVNSRVFSARTDEVGVKRAVKNFALQKENYFLDYSRPSTTAEIRDEIPGSPLGNSKWNPSSVLHHQTPQQISPLATTQLKSRHSQEFLSLSHGLVGVSMNLNNREDSTLSDETIGHYGGSQLSHHNASNSHNHPNYYPSHNHHQQQQHHLYHMHHSNEIQYGHLDQQQQQQPNNSRPSSRHPRNSKLGTAR